MWGYRRESLRRRRWIQAKMLFAHVMPKMAVASAHHKDMERRHPVVREAVRRAV